MYCYFRRWDHSWEGEKMMKNRTQLNIDIFSLKEELMSVISG